MGVCLLSHKFQESKRNSTSTHTYKQLLTKPSNQDLEFCIKIQSFFLKNQTPQPQQSQKDENFKHTNFWTDYSDTKQKRKKKQ